MAESPGLLLREPLGSSLLKVFNFYVKDQHKLDTLSHLNREDVLNFYVSAFPHKKNPTLHDR
jgi:hypothetical protein